MIYSGEQIIFSKQIVNLFESSPGESIQQDAGCVIEVRPVHLQRYRLAFRARATCSVERTEKYDGSGHMDDLGLTLTFHDPHWHCKSPGQTRKMKRSGQSGVASRADARVKDLLVSL